jgi:hypothetical protein
MKRLLTCVCVFLILAGVTASILRANLPYGHCTGPCTGCFCTLQVNQQLSDCCAVCYDPGSGVLLTCCYPDPPCRLA